METRQSAGNSTAQMKRVRELDGLRAVAILLVLMCHYPGFVRLTGGFAEFGWVGVDIFFVLSGYLITTILLDLRTRRHPYSTFYSRRAIRIFPPYFAVTFLIIIAGFVAHGHHVTSLRYVLRQVLFLQAYHKPYALFLLYWIEHPLRQLAHLPDLLTKAGHLTRGPIGDEPSPEAQSATYWSLSIEEFFYLFWAPVVLLFRRRWIITLGLAICIVECILRWSYGTRDAYFGIIFRYDSLIYGAFLAILIEHWKRRRVPPLTIIACRALLTAAVSGLAVILFLIAPVRGLEIRDSPLFLVIGMPLISVGCAAVIAMLVLQAESNWWLARFLRTNVMRKIGTVSYTMYLVEILAILAVCHLPGLRWNPQQSLGKLLCQAALAVVLTFSLALISWHYLEKPLQQWKNSKLDQGRRGKTTPALT